MAEEGTERLRALAGALERVFATEVLEADEPDYWTQRSQELIEEIEAEGLLLE